MHKTIGKNYWKYIHDMTAVPSERHWRFAERSEFALVEKKVDGMAEDPTFAVPVPLVVLK